MSGLGRLFGGLRRTRSPRLVVVPFDGGPGRDLGPSAVPGGGAEAPADVGWFGRGVAAELIDLLTHDPVLDVIAPRSSGRFGAAELDRAASELNADLALTGSLELDSEEFRAEARLLRLPGGQELWAGGWTRRHDELFGVLAEIAARVAAEAQGRASGAAEPQVHRDPTTDPTAWLLRLRGMDVATRATTASGFETAIAWFEAALERDELFADAAAGIAEAYRAAHERFLTVGPEEDTLAALRDVAERVLEVDATVPDAHLALAYADLLAWRPEAAELRLRHLTDARPSHARAHALLGRTRLYRRDLQGAMDSFDRALSLDPLNPDITNESGLPYAMQGRLDVAEERSRSVVHRDPENAMAYFHLGRYAEQAGRYGEAVTYYRAAAELSGRVPNLTAFLGMALIGAGDRHEAEDIANDLERKARRGSAVATCLGVLLLRLGRGDEAMSWFERALEQRELPLLLLDTPWLPIPSARRRIRMLELLARLPDAAARP